ncbi:21507_t:CDS:2, partial [Gigaspora margarita]
KQRTSNQTQELRYNISKKDKAIAKWLGLEDQELGSDSTHKDIQTHLNTKEVLILAECGIMDYGTLKLQEALNNNTDENAAKDSTVSAQQSTKSTILSLKDEQSISKTKNEDIYSSQWMVTRNEAEALQKLILAPKNKLKSHKVETLHIPLNSNNNQSSIAWLYFSSQVDLENSARKNSLKGSLSDKTNTSPSTQRITEVRKQTYSSFSSSKAKYTGKENISQTDLLQEILKRLNHLEISQKE